MGTSIGTIADTNDLLTRMGAAGVVGSPKQIKEQEEAAANFDATENSPATRQRSLTKNRKNNILGGLLGSRDATIQDERSIKEGGGLAGMTSGSRFSVFSNASTISSAGVSSQVSGINLNSTAELAVPSFGKEKRISKVQRRTMVAAGNVDPVMARRVTNNIGARRGTVMRRPSQVEGHAIGHGLLHRKGSATLGANTAQAMEQMGIEEQKSGLTLTALAHHHDKPHEDGREEEEEDEGGDYDEEAATAYFSKNSLHPDGVFMNVWYMFNVSAIMFHILCTPLRIAFCSNFAGEDSDEEGLWMISPLFSGIYCFLEVRRSKERGVKDVWSESTAKER